MIQIILKTQEFELKEGTKTAYKLAKEETEQIDELIYNRFVNSSKSFKSRLTFGYTCAGYKAVKDVATAPNKSTKTVRFFDFKYID
jgi:hypothetical protein